jgi:dTDP-4-dehydrorhamnose 3,5-epimerase
MSQLGVTKLLDSRVIADPLGYQIRMANARDESNINTKKQDLKCRMQFNKTKLERAYIIDLERRQDSRGFFARAFCQKEFAAHGLNPVIVQTNVAYNFKKGTLRGMHFQFPPAAETKLVRCTRGAILDIIVDLRPESPTYLQHIAVELNEENGRALYVPERFAHGYQTLCDNTETSYQVGEFYAPDHESGLMHDDPRLGLRWPLPVAVISDKDQKFNLLDNLESELRRRMTI